MRLNDEMKIHNNEYVLIIHVVCIKNYLSYQIMRHVYLYCGFFYCLLQLFSTMTSRACNKTL